MIIHRERRRCALQVEGRNIGTLYLTQQVKLKQIGAIIAGITNQPSDHLPLYFVVEKKQITNFITLDRRVLWYRLKYQGSVTE